METTLTIMAVLIVIMTLVYSASWTIKHWSKNEEDGK